MTWSVKIAGVEETTGAVRAAIEQGEIDGMQLIGERGVQLTVEHTPVGATGNLANTIFPHLEQGAGLLTEIITAGPPADVYSAPVEEGTRPHFPPYEALIPWVVRKFGVTDEQAARALAFVIARKISRRGTMGAHMFAQALNALEAEAVGILERSIAESLGQSGVAAH
jgi:hypothetical protein